MKNNERYEKLKEVLRGYGSVCVAFSGGVDSTFLLYAAVDTLGCDNVLAVTARSASFPERELKEAMDFCGERGISNEIIDSEELNIEGFSKNPPNRCYLCKHELFTKIKALAMGKGIETVLEASNVDDEGDYRPGMQAVLELGAKSPLRECGFTKNCIRETSRVFGLPTWDKQSFACLSSRFVYGEDITPARLAMVDKAEQLLLDMGFRFVRVRVHGNEKSLARIELLPEDFGKLAAPENKEKVCDALKKLGFAYITLDLWGYQTGSMNATLP